MFIHKSHFDHINIVSLVSIFLHIFFIFISIYYNFNNLLLPIIILSAINIDIIKRFIDNLHESFLVRNKLINIVKKYHEKKNMERIRENKNKIIKNISNQITANLIDDSLHELNLLKHKESMKKILENINQIKLFSDFFGNFNLILLNYDTTEKNFLNELIKYCNSNNKEICLISQKNPNEIDLNCEILTPYHFNKSLFYFVYKKNKNNFENKVNLDNSFLFNYYLNEKKQDNNVVCFGESIDNIMSFDIDLDHNSFLNILEDWIEN